MDDLALSHQYQNIWETMWTDMQKYGPVHRHQRRIYRLLLKSVQNVPFESVLDVGCGTGDNLVFIKSIFPSMEASGIDIAETPLKVARERIHDGRFWIDDIQNPKQIKSRFDLVTFLDVIEHLEDDMKALENISKITNKYLLLSTLGGRMREVEREIGHYRNYGVSRLNDMLESVGFRQKKTVQWGFPLYSPVFRAIAASPRVVTLSYGKYNLRQKLLCQFLYFLYFLNSWNKGDKIIILAEKD